MSARVQGPTGESGQIASVAAVVVGVLLVGVAGLGLIATAMIERQAATVAADAVAVGAALDEQASAALADWYRDRGIEVAGEVDGDARASARVGAATARSRAQTDRGLDEAPAAVAVVARARQLLAEGLSSAQIDGITISLAASDATRFAMVADELVVCEIGTTDRRRVWQLC